MLHNAAAYLDVTAGGARDEIYKYPDGDDIANGLCGHELMAVPGINAASGTSITTISLVSDPKFTNNQAAR